MEGARKGSSCRKDVVEITIEGRERQDECNKQIQIDMNNMSLRLLETLRQCFIRASSL